MAGGVGQVACSCPPPSHARHNRSLPKGFQGWEVCGGGVGRGETHWLTSHYNVFMAAGMGREGSATMPGWGQRLLGCYKAGKGAGRQGAGWGQPTTTPTLPCPIPFLTTAMPNAFWEQVTRDIERVKSQCSQQSTGTKTHT